MFCTCIRFYYVILNEYFAKYIINMQYYRTVLNIVIMNGNQQLTDTCTSKTEVVMVK